MIPSYQQIPPVPTFDGSSLKARGISQPSFNTSGNIVSTDLDVPPVVSPLSRPLLSLDVQAGKSRPACGRSTPTSGPSPGAPHLQERRR
jgi:hypothetical protein